MKHTLQQTVWPSDGSKHTGENSPNVPTASSTRVQKQTNFCMCAWPRAGVSLTRRWVVCRGNHSCLLEEVWLLQATRSVHKKQTHKGNYKTCKHKKRDRHCGITAFTNLRIHWDQKTRFSSEHEGARRGSSASKKTGEDIQMYDARGSHRGWAQRVCLKSVRKWNQQKQSRENTSWFLLQMYRENEGCDQDVTKLKVI